MPFDLTTLLSQRRGDKYRLYARYINPVKAGIVETGGYKCDYTRAEGCYVYDRTGSRYLELLGGMGVFALGCNNPVVKTALIDAIAADIPGFLKMDCDLLTGLLAESLIKSSRQRFGGCFFANSGTESVEAALKFARFASGRQRILYCHRAFHGLTYGSLSLNGNPAWRDGFGPLLPACDEVVFGDSVGLESELSKGNVAAFVVEPIQGEGVHLPPPDYLGSVERLCRQHGALFVADEIQTGMGRTGRFLAVEHWGVTPDMVTLSKGLSGGYIPIGVVLMKKDLFDRLSTAGVAHGSTFQGNALAMTAGLAALHVMTEEGLIERTERMGSRLVEALTPFVGRYELLKEVRGKGLMIGIEFSPPSTTRLKCAYHIVESVQRGLFFRLMLVHLFRKHRMIVGVGAPNVIKLLPPLVIGEVELNEFVQAFENWLSDLHSFPGEFWDFAMTLAGKAANARLDLRGKPE